MVFEDINQKLCGPLKNWFGVSFSDKFRPCVSSNISHISRSNGLKLPGNIGTCSWFIARFDQIRIIHLAGQSSE